MNLYYILSSLLNYCDLNSLPDLVKFAFVTPYKVRYSGTQGYHSQQSIHHAQTILKV